MITDIYMIWFFYVEGETTFANANIAMIIVNWLIQLLIVFMQTGRNILGIAFLKEAVIATVGLKPGLDAWNVCIGKEQQQGQLFHPMEEVRIGKGRVIWEKGIVFKTAKKKLNLTVSPRPEHPSRR